MKILQHALVVVRQRYVIARGDEIPVRNPGMIQIVHQSGNEEREYFYLRHTDLLFHRANV